MSKKYRIDIRFVALSLILTTVTAFAGGKQESDLPESEEALFGGADSLDSAIQLANLIPDKWDYDPRDRVVHDVNASIEYPFQLDDAEWAQRLDPFEYFVLRQAGTENPFSDSMHENKQPGIYYSRATGQPLFRSEDKYDSETGWPSFTRPINPYAIVYVEDVISYTGIEVVDSLSGSHLGHVFPDGPRPTGQRYCINAASLIFVPDGQERPALIEELQTLVAGK